MAKDTTGTGPCFAIEDRLAARVGCRRIAGVDEAGRGPLAGPVVAACVLLDRRAVPEGLDDSKRLAAPRRAELCELVMASAEVGIGIATVAEIDALNILRANDLAMRRAMAALGALSGVVIDGNRVPPGTDHPAEAVVGGDGLALGVAAASIVAKVTRDRIMTNLDRAFPGYGWSTNFGYATRAHREALRQLGLSPHHRRSFRCDFRFMCEESHRTG